MNRLTAMMLFRRVAELGSFAAAARETGFSNAAVSKNIAGLEAHLGVRLLERSTRRLRLTAAGDAYLQRCVQILDAIEEAELEAAEDALAPRGLLRVSVPMSMGLLHIAPLLGRFLESCPEVELDIVMSDRKVNLIEEGFDVALRAGGPLPDSSLMARQLAPIARQPRLPISTGAARPQFRTTSQTTTVWSTAFRKRRDNGSWRDRRAGGRSRFPGGCA